MTEHYYIQDDQNTFHDASQKNNRRHVRFPVCLTVEYSQKSPVEFNSFILNMSARGCYIKTDDPFPGGSDIILRLSIPKIKTLVTLTGKVIWINNGESPLPPGMGISFNEDNKDALEQLNAYLEEELPLLDRQA
jgi:uncharacterized protein (TIGR02266 family)